jgi:predicted phosphoribosyltransferase
MNKFANLFEAGAELGSLLQGLDSATIIIPIMPNGVPVALGIESVIGVRDLVPLYVDRTETGVDPAHLGVETALRDRSVVLVDDGVETGTAAKACGAWLRNQGVANLSLAVPVCPKTSANAMQFIFDSIIAINAPLGSQALTWHYDNFDVIDVAAATELLATRKRQLDQ